MRLLLGLLLISNLLFSQAPSINILGGNDTAICGNISLNLTCAFDTTVLKTNTYSVQSIPYNPFPYTTGILFPTPVDDKWSPIQTLPFTFCFYGQSFTQYILSTNGIISFNLTYANAFSFWTLNNPIPTSAVNFPRSMIGLYHDIDPTLGGTIRYGVVGVAPYRKLVVSFSNVAQYSCSASKSTFQIVLHETTHIIDIHVFRKPSCVIWNNGRACLGIQNNAGTLAAFPPGRNTSSYNITVAESWRFSPNTPQTQPQWFVNGVLTSIGYNFAGTFTAPSTIMVKYQYSCPATPTSDAISISELPCCNPISVILNTN
jgi:hypothetical protein